MSIPNIITILRIVLIPFFVVQLFSGHYYLAFIILLFSGITDIADGFIARRFNMITRLGTILDPAADKLMQFTVFLCLYMVDLIPSWLVLLLFVKEITMAIGTFVLLKKACGCESKRKRKNCDGCVLCNSYSGFCSAV